MARRDLNHENLSSATDAAADLQEGRGRRLAILGTRGIPADHGGFEVFAEHLSQYLTERDWRVSVYCQAGPSESYRESDWRGVTRIHIPAAEGSVGSVLFDLRSVLHAARRGGLIYTLGYNTALFNLVFRAAGVVNLINMDGFEWKRSKWSPPIRAWLRLNERAACIAGHRLVADNPAVAEYLERIGVSADRISMAPYGARAVDDADAGLISRFGVRPGAYALVVARPEPENSILEIVKAYRASACEDPLLVLGAFEPADNAYHREVIAESAPHIHFPGAVFDGPTIDALRRHCWLYLHGHQVGGTNPSLVEALGAGSPVLAHGNAFNRWVAGEAAAYFDSIETCAAEIGRLSRDPERRAAMSLAARERHRGVFQLPDVLSRHQAILESALRDPRGANTAAAPASRASGR